MKINNSYFKIKTILNVNKKKLFKFYCNNYSKKFFFLKKNWKWLYRVHFSKKILPIIFLKDNKIISHSGSIPFNIYINRKIYIASWFVDFLIVPKYQRKGIGSNLVKIWMKKRDVGVTFCNKKSLAIFKNYNWKIYKNFFIYLIPINPFNIPKLKFIFNNKLGKFLNKIFFYFFYKINKLNKKNISDISFLKISEKNLSKLIQNKNIEDLEPIRDSKYFKWRVLNSPFKKKYEILEYKDNLFLVKRNKIGNFRFLEVLLKPRNIKVSSLKDSLNAINIWAFKKNYCYIKFLFNKEELNDLNLLFILKKKLNFAFYTKIKLKRIFFSYDLIDSDFEFTNR